MDNKTPINLVGTTQPNHKTNESKALEPKGNSFATHLILELIAIRYGVMHVHIHHQRERIYKIVPAMSASGLPLYLANNQQIFIHQRQFKGKGGRTYASILLADGYRLEAVAVTNNSSKFIKKIGYNEAVYNLWDEIINDKYLNNKFIQI